LRPIYIPAKATERKLSDLTLHNEDSLVWSKGLERRSFGDDWARRGGIDVLKKKVEVVDKERRRTGQGVLRPSKYSTGEGGKEKNIERPEWL